MSDATSTKLEPTSTKLEPTMTKLEPTRTELLPCPFCGGEATLRDARKYLVVSRYSYMFPFSVGCENKQCKVKPYTLRASCWTCSNGRHGVTKSTLQSL